MSPQNDFFELIRIPAQFVADTLAAEPTTKPKPKRTDSLPITLQEISSEMDKLLKPLREKVQRLENSVNHHSEQVATYRASLTQDALNRREMEREQRISTREAKDIADKALELKLATMEEGIRNLKGIATRGAQIETKLAE